MNLDALERLVRLRDSGALSEVEFETQKARLLAEPGHRPERYNRTALRAAILAAALAGAGAFSWWVLAGSADREGVETGVHENSTQFASPSSQADEKGAARLKSEASPRAPVSKAAGGGDRVIVEAGTVPTVFRGTWGTSDNNCADRDDYGPLRVTRRGFAHYEVVATVVNIRKSATSTVAIDFQAEDPAGEEPYAFREVWRYDAPTDRLIATTYQGGEDTTTYRRC